MAYVDLNPIRAGVVATPEKSEFTSIYSRIQALRPQRHPSVSSAKYIQTERLFPFQDHVPADTPAIPMSSNDYLQLVDWSGRIVRADKTGFIDDQAPSLLERLNIDPGVWRDAMRIRGNVFGRALGRLDRLRLHAHALGQARVRGLNQARRLFRTV